MVGNWVKDLTRRAEALMPPPPIEAVAGTDSLEAGTVSIENSDQLTETTTGSTVADAQGE